MGSPFPSFWGFNPTSNPQGSFPNPLIPVRVPIECPACECCLRVPLLLGFALCSCVEPWLAFVELSFLALAFRLCFAACLGLRTALPPPQKPHLGFDFLLFFVAFSACLAALFVAFVLVRRRPESGDGASSKTGCRLRTWLGVCTFFCCSRSSSHFVGFRAKEESSVAWLWLESWFALLVCSRLLCLLLGRL